MPKKYKVLIIGSSGMLGTDLCKELRHKYEVIGTDLAGSRESAAGRFKKADITDRKSITAFIKQIRPFLAVHTAAYTDVDGCELNPEKAYKINSDGTRNIALACKACGATLIYISTDFVFDGKKQRPYRETDEAHPVSVYGDSKLKGEEAVKNILKKYFILRTSWLYGKYGKNFVNTIIAKAKSDKVLKVVNDQIGSPTYTKDLAKAIRKLMDKIVGSRQPVVGSFGIYHVSNSGSVSWFDYAKKILSRANIRALIIPISSKNLDRPAKRPAMSVLDNAKFVKLTGYRMRGWQEALKEYV